MFKLESVEEERGQYCSGFEGVLSLGDEELETQESHRCQVYLFVYFE